MTALTNNPAWNEGYEDAKRHRQRRYENGPIAIVGVAAYDYSQGYRAGNQDSVWANGNRPPMSAEASVPARNSFWVIERFEDGRSAGYWDGASSRSFQPDIDKAIQFRRKEDAFWATRSWHWKDIQLTEHLYICAAEPSSCVSLLMEALELIQEDIDNRDGRDNFDMSCGNCEGAIPVKHSFGCRARQAISEARSHTTNGLIRDPQKTRNCYTCNAPIGLDAYWCEKCDKLRAQ